MHFRHFLKKSFFLKNFRKVFLPRKNPDYAHAVNNRQRRQISYSNTGVLEATECLIEGRQQFITWGWSVGNFSTVRHVCHHITYWIHCIIWLPIQIHCTLSAISVDIWDWKSIHFEVNRWFVLPNSNLNTQTIQYFNEKLIKAVIIRPTKVLLDVFFKTS